MKIIGMILVGPFLLVDYILHKIEGIVNKGVDGFGYTTGTRWYLQRYKK